MSTCHPRVHHLAIAAVAALALSSLAACGPIADVSTAGEESPAAAPQHSQPGELGPDFGAEAPKHAVLTPADPLPVAPLPFDPTGVTLDPAVRDENAGTLARADLDLLVASHPLVQQHLAAHPEQATVLRARLDEILALPTPPRVFFIAAGQRVAYPMTQVVSFRAEALVKRADGSLATQAMVVSGPAVSFGGDPEPGLFLGAVGAAGSVAVSLNDVDASVFWANGPRNSAWSAYWQGHQEVLTTVAGLDLVVANLGFAKLAPLELVVPGMIVTVDAESSPRLLRAAGAADIEQRWWETEPAGAPMVLEAGGLRARLAGGVLTLEQGGTTRWTRPVDATVLVALDADAGRIIVAGAHVTSVVTLAGELELRLPFGPGGDLAGDVVLQDGNGYDPTSACDNLMSLVAYCNGLALKYGMVGWSALAVYYTGWAQYYSALATAMGCMS